MAGRATAVPAPPSGANADGAVGIALDVTSRSGAQAAASAAMTVSAWILFNEIAVTTRRECRRHASCDGQEIGECRIIRRGEKATTTLLSPRAVIGGVLVLPERGRRIQSRRSSRRQVAGGEADGNQQRC